MERTISGSSNRYRFIKLSSIWNARTMIVFLVWRDFILSYKQTVLGALWTLVKPLIMSFTIILIFEKVGDFPNYGHPYLLIAMSSLTIWEFFSSAVNKGSLSLVDERELITKINFPRIIIPISASIINGIGLVINQLVIIGLMIFYDTDFTLRLLLIPIIYLLIIAVNLGAILMLSSLNVFYRDIKNVVPFILRLGLFISPVGFTLQSIPESWQVIYCANPVVIVIELMRFSILGDPFLPDQACLLTGMASILVFLGFGMWVFGRSERRFADVI